MTDHAQECDMTPPDNVATQLHWLSKDKDGTLATAVALLVGERRRHTSVEGWTPEHDDEHRDGHLALAAACYATPPDLRSRGGDTVAPELWPWAREWWKPGDGSYDGRIRELTKAGSLILAELERLLRAEIAERNAASSPAPELDWP